MSGGNCPKPGRRFDRESINRESYERELAGLREALRGPAVSVPMTASELYELERLIHKYPAEARRLVAALPDDQ